MNVKIKKQFSLNHHPDIAQIKKLEARASSKFKTYAHENTKYVNNYQLSS